MRRTWKKRRNLNTSKTTNMPHNSRCDAKNLNCRALAVHETKQERQGQNSKVLTCSAPQSSAEPERGRWRIFILYCTFTKLRASSAVFLPYNGSAPLFSLPAFFFLKSPRLQTAVPPIWWRIGGGSASQYSSITSSHSLDIPPYTFSPSASATTPGRGKTLSPDICVMRIKKHTFDVDRLLRGFDY